jgi:hypothetical protein
MGVPSPTGKTGVGVMLGVGVNEGVNVAVLLGVNVNVAVSVGVVVTVGAGVSNGNIVQLDPSSIRMVQIKITCFIKIVPFSSTLRRLTWD